MAGWTTNYMHELSFTASQGSQIFNSWGLLGMEKKSMTSWLELVLHIQHQCQRNNVTLRASLCLVRGLYMISMTHSYDVLSLLFKLLNWFYIFKTLKSHLCYFLLNLVVFICFSTYFFDNITLCINLLNVTSSNISHLVYITLFGETDGVTLLRLGCKTASIAEWMMRGWWVTIFSSTRYIELVCHLDKDSVC